MTKDKIEEYLQKALQDGPASAVDAAPDEDAVREVVELALHKPERFSPGKFTSATMPHATVEAVFGAARGIHFSLAGNGRLPDDVADEVVSAIAPAVVRILGEVAERRRVKREREGHAVRELGRRRKDTVETAEKLYQLAERFADTAKRSGDGLEAATIRSDLMRPLEAFVRRYNGNLKPVDGAADAVLEIHRAKRQAHEPVEVVA